MGEVDAALVERFAHDRAFDAGIAAKFVGGMVNWVLAVYFLNLAALAVNWAIFFRNRAVDAQRAADRAA